MAEVNMNLINFWLSMILLCNLCQRGTQRTVCDIVGFDEFSELSDLSLMNSVNTLQYET